MKNVTIFDANNLFVRCFFVKSIGAKSKNPDYQLWKHLCVESVYRSLFKGRVDEVVLAVDDSVSWRKLYWERYKESRKWKRDKSGVNWTEFHQMMDSFLYEIKSHLPFKVIKVPNAEGDDIIAVICTSREAKYVVISTDEDYKQLCSEHIRLYNPLSMKFINCSDTEKFIVEKCLIGQPKDDIFNIKTALDHPVGERKPPFGETAAEKIIEYGYEEWLEENDLEERFNVNRVLIDFKKIPQVIRRRILSAYDNYIMPDPENIYKFFKDNKLQSYLEKISDVENKLMTLL